MSKNKSWLLYGATGYTGTHIAEKAVAYGYKPVLAGRRKDEVKALAERLGLEWRVADLADAAALNTMVAEFSTVLHVAGPFAQTYTPMINACIANGAHYLDITGEIAAFEGLAEFDAQARKAGIMILPGCGFDMVPGDCLALSLKRKMPDATHLDIAISFEGTLTRGTIKSMEATDPLARVRRNHKLDKLPAPFAREFDFGSGACGGRAAANAVTFGDISVSWRSTGIPNITVYIRPAKAFAGLENIKSLADIDRLPAGPSAAELRDIPSVFLGEARNDAGEVCAMRLVTPQVYAITFDTAAKIAQRVCDGTYRTGFQTPASVFGEDFILEFDGCTLEPWAAGYLPS